MDIGSAVGREFGITEEELGDLPAYKTSNLFFPIGKTRYRICGGND